MSTQEFAVVVDHRATGTELDALFEAGCDDATPERRDDITVLWFDRAADELSAAITSALDDVARAGLRVVAVHAGVPA